ncbi:SseB family protein [Microbacterium sp. CJ88]|uniref:SseB family protein n=1 Tax=Microbacterium sp. CJ88 TaxID=3445672 RepID=UPI003F65AA03
MGIFSRSKRSAPAESADAAAAPIDEEADASTPPDGEADASATAGSSDVEAVAAPAVGVGISVSTFRGVGAAAGEATPVAAPDGSAGGTGIPSAVSAPRVRPPAEAPEAREGVSGLRDNGLLRAALASLPDDPAPDEILGVARQLLQGHVFLRVRGDARTLLSRGEDLPLLVASQGDLRYVLVYSGGEALQASVRDDGDTETSAMAQPVTAVLQHVLAGPYAGIVLDHSSAPARLVLPRDLLEKALADTSPELTVKSLLSAPRTDATAAEIVAALPEAPLWIAANKTPDGQVGIAEARSPEGDRFLEVFSHPLEVFAMGRKDQPVTLTVSQLAAAVASDEELSGVLLDPAGPWIQLSRSDLASILALA